MRNNIEVQAEIHHTPPKDTLLNSPEHHAFSTWSGNLVLSGSQTQELSLGSLHCEDLAEQQEETLAEIDEQEVQEVSVRNVKMSRLDSVRKSSRISEAKSRKDSLNLRKIQEIEHGRLLQHRYSTTNKIGTD